MSLAAELCRRAADLGLRLEPAGDKLAVFPKGHCPPDFADTLRQHKGELLDWLEAQAVGLRQDEAPWLYVARQVLAGEFDRCDQSTRESVTIGLPVQPCSSSLMDPSSEIVWWGSRAIPG